MTSYWARWRLKSPVWPLFTQPFIQAQIKENIKAPRHWLLCGKFTGDQWIHRKIASKMRKMFPVDDAIMRKLFYNFQIRSRIWNWLLCYMKVSSRNSTPHTEWVAIFQKSWHSHKQCNSIICIPQSITSLITLKFWYGVELNSTAQTEALVKLFLNTIAMFCSLAMC